jgi:hypothetical protein
VEVSCTSVLVVPQRKPSLVEAFHGGWPLPDLELDCRPWGARQRGSGGGGEERGKGRG